MSEKQKLYRRNTYTPADAPHGNSIIIKGVEKKLDISIKKVKIIKHGKGLRFSAQFLPTLSHGVFLGGVR
jgi:hypothetical protein